MEDRHLEHIQNSTVATTSSCLYRSYPDKSSNTPIEIGVFEDLTQYVALGFTREDGVAVKNLTCRDGGLFIWREEMKKRISKINFAGSKSLLDKKLHMITYLFEICYDIALSSSWNVSESPGFETPIGYWC